MRLSKDEFGLSVDARASRWVTCEREGLSEQEKRDFEGWLAESPDHRLAYERLSAMSEAFQRMRDRGSGPSVIGELRARSKRRHRTTAAAAVALAAVALAVFVSPRFREQTPSPLAADAPFEPIQRLSDGTIVELNKGAQIKVDFDTRFRRVALVRGEALFRVAHDASHPFIVSTHGVEVRAVGTAFSVKLSRSAVDVLVTEGAVRVEDSGRGVSLLPPAEAAVATFAPNEPVLTAGQEAVVSLSDGSIASPAQVNKLKADEMTKTLSWREPNFNFDGVRLADAVRRLNTLNRIQIILADESLGNLRISGSFSSDDPETFSRLVARPFGLQAHRLSDVEIELSRN